MAEATRNLHDNKEILGLRCELRRARKVATIRGQRN
jgi:hypothetical protein